MADVWETIMYPASYGGISIDIISTRDTFRRTLVQHAPPRRDGAIVQDTGAEARVVAAQVIFFEREGDPGSPDDQRNHVDRARAFVDLANRGRPQEFVHPIFGSFPALAEDLQVTALAEDRDQITIEAVFVEQGVNPPPLLSQVASQTDGAAASVALYAQIARDEVEISIGAGTLSATDGGAVVAVCDDAETTVESWSADPDITPRDITAGLQRISTTISDTLNDLEFATDVANYPIVRAMHQLHYQVRRAANAARQDAPALIEVTVAAPTPLRLILVDVYGAEEHDRHYDEAIRLNEIDDPTMIASGVRVSLPTPDSVGQQRTRRKGGAR